jgi:hypothetical protein
MNYVINPYIQPKYLEINKKFDKIKNNQMSNIIPELNILISNNISSCSIGNFFEVKKKYINKIISIFIIKKKGIEHIIGPIFIINEQILTDIINYIGEFILSENVYIDEQENLDKQILNYYNELDNNNYKYTNVIYN